MPSGLPRVHVIIPAHNRRELTLGCLRHLRQTGVLAWARPVVVDDGSADGTGAAVVAEFPDVAVLTGDGRLWWTGAIVRGMRHALADGDTEAVFWLNDDCRPAAGTLELLRDTALAGPCLAVGQVFGRGGLKHGGLRKRWHGLDVTPCPPGRVVNVATMNGNCVCLPAAIIARAGLPDAAHFPQACGDTDYGFRCRRLGLAIRLVGSAVCTEAGADDPAATSWLTGGRPLGEIAASFGSPKNYFHPPAWWRFTVRHWGPLGVGLFLAPYLRFGLIALARMLIPTAVLRRLRGDG
jgi:GT2 family glycosyltransferase